MNDDPWRTPPGSPGGYPAGGDVTPEQRTFLQRVGAGPGWGILVGFVWSSIVLGFVYVSDSVTGSLAGLALFLVMVGLPVALLFVRSWRRFAIGWLIVVSFTPIIFAGMCVVSFINQPVY